MRRLLSLNERLNVTELEEALAKLAHTTPLMVMFNAARTVIEIGIGRQLDGDEQQKVFFAVSQARKRRLKKGTYGIRVHFPKEFTGSKQYAES